MTLQASADWETTTPLDAGINALSYARQAAVIHRQQLAATSVPEGATSYRVPGAERATRYGPRRPLPGPPTPGGEPLGPLVGNSWRAREARDHIPVVVTVAFRDLARGYSGFGASGWEPEAQPQEPLLYPSAHNVELVHAESFGPHAPPQSPTVRPFSIGLIDKPDTVTATPHGTEVLTAATSTLRILAGYLTEYAAISPVGEKRRYEAEAEIYTAHARACESQILRTLTWLPAFEQELTPVPPFEPITIPAQLRGAIAIGPY